MKRCHAKKKYFWQSDCLSNLAILYGLCILHSSFLLTISVWGYLIIIAYYAPNFKEVDGAYWFPDVRVSICPSVCQQPCMLGF